MKKISFKTIVLVTMVSLVLPGGLAGGFAVAAEVAPCEGTNVSGTIVAIDENGVITIDTNGAEEGGLCTVTITADETQDHPIVLLLGEFFGTGDPQASDFTGALTSTQGWALYDETTDTWSWVSEGTENAVAVQVLSFDETTGLFTAVYLDETTGEEVTITFAIDDASVADPIKGALADLVVNWNIENGDVVLTGEQIAAYHDSGLGFGVLVKLYAMAQVAGIPVQELVDLFDNGAGMGMGELFKLYGKPKLTGVGHVRQELKAGNTATTTTDTSANSQGNGKGKGNANGKSQKENKSNNGKAKGKDK